MGHEHGRGEEVREGGIWGAGVFFVICIYTATAQVAPLLKWPWGMSAEGMGGGEGEEVREGGIWGAGVCFYICIYTVTVQVATRVMWA